MRHSFLDKYSELSSPIHHLDPRIKIILLFTFILFVIFTPPTHLLQFFLYLIVILIVIFLTRVPFSHFLKRSILILPFVLLIAIFIPFLKEGEVAGGYNLGSLHLSVTYNGLWIFWNILIKSYLSVLSMITLSSTTKFPDLLKGLEYFKMPRVMIMLLSFMYRYLFLLIDEAQKCQRAHQSRFFGRNYLAQFKISGNIIGVLFIRTYERGERIYLAMLSRGFDGRAKTLSRLKLGRWDIVFASFFLSGLILIKVLEGR